MIQLFLWQAQAWFFLNNFGKAMNLIDQAIQIHPDKAESWCEKGLFLTKMEKYKEAAECFDKAGNLSPDFYLVWHGRLCLLIKRGQPEKALIELEQLLQKFPDQKKELRLEKDFKPLYKKIEFWDLVN